MFLIFILFTFIRWQNKRNFQRACQMGGRFRFKSKSTTSVCYVLSARQHKTQRYSLSKTPAPQNVYITIMWELIHETIYNTLHYKQQLQWSRFTVHFQKKYLQQRRGPVETIHVSSRTNSCVLSNPRMLVSKEWAFLRQTKRVPKITVLHMQLSFSGFAVLHSPCGSTETLWFGT